MKRPVVLIAGGVAAALVMAGVGASAHTGLLSKSVGTHSSIVSDENPGSEPSETPEAQATSEPAEAPETEAGDNDEQGEDNDEQGENDD